MSDDEADPEILALLREQLGLSAPAQQGVSCDTGVLRDAEHIAYNSIDVFIDMLGTQSAALKLYKAMRERNYSTQTWSEHELHPKLGDDVDEVGLVNFVFTMDLLNFSFWSELGAEERYQTEYRGKRWTGYNSLVVCLRRALDEGIPITTPGFWRADEDFDATMKHVFRSATAEEAPLLSKRIAILREAADVLHENFGDDDDTDEINSVSHQVVSDAASEPEPPAESHGMSSSSTLSEANAGVQSSEAHEEKNAGLIHGSSMEVDTPHDGSLRSAAQTELHEAEMSGLVQTQEMSDVDNHTALSTPNLAGGPKSPDLTVIRLIQEADHSAGKLVNLLAKYFPCFRDEGRFEGRKVRFLKRAQIFVADLWAAFNGEGLGHFQDISHLTMFADYRVPQMLYNLGVLSFSPPLESRIRRQVELELGHSWEMQLRGCSIWAVELIRRQITKDHPEAAAGIHSVLLDFLMYDLAKEREANGTESIPHHRTRSVWY